MPKFILAVFILLMMMSSGCNNPSGGSVIGRGNAPFLQKPAAFAFTQIRSADGIVDIAWQRSQRVASYEFYISTDPLNITTVVPECSGIVESCRILGLDPDTLYYFDIKSTNDAGSTKVTSVGRARSVYSFAGTGATAGDGSITLSWNPSTNSTSFNLIYGTSSGSYPSTVTNVTSPYVLSGLTNGVRYYIRVVAVNGDNGYALSTNELNQQPFGPLPAPTGLLLTATPGQILLDWADSAGATNYKIYKGLTAGSVAEIVTGNVPSTYTDSGTTDGTSYFYAIKAFNGFDSPLSTVASARSITGFNMTSAVTGPAPTQVTVTWPDTTGEDAYDIRYGSNPAALNLTATNVTSPHVFTGLTGGLPYFFRVVARNAVGAGTTQLSNNQLSATPIAPIASPTGLTATSSPASVTLNWTAVPGATEYRVYRGLTAGTVAFLVGGVPSNTYTDNTVANGTTYFYSVRAFNGFDSLDSAQVSTRPISSFTFTSATVASFSSADLVWGGATGAATYDIRYGTSSGSYTTTVTNRTSPTTLTGLSASTTYFIAIRANNAVGTGTSITSNELTFTTGTLFPTVSITTYPLINNANKASYTVSGACSENGRIVTVSVGGVTSTPTCTASAWTTTMNVTAAADSATLAVTANHINSGGNPANASRSVIKDTVNPVVAITSSPAINNTNEAAYTVSGTCTENTRTVSVVVGGIAASPVCTTLAWSATVNTSALGDGPVAITADMNDAAGNTATQATASVTKDTVIPSVAITSSPVINNANKNAYTVSGTCSETGRMVNVMVGSTSGSNTCTLLTWSVTLNVSGNADSATLVITADHSDTAGNAAVQAGTSVLKDTTNPTVAITVYPVINNANKAAYTFSGTCSENTRTVSVSVGGIAGTPTCTALAWSATLDVSALADGAAISITANHTDSAGNNATQATRSVLKNTALPTVAITSSTVINNANKAAYVVSGTCSESTRIVTVNVGGVAGTPTCSGGNTWTSTLNVTAVADNAAVAITADHTDSVGNNAVQATTNVLKDTVIPTVAITSSPVINNANKAAYPVSGTCSENTRNVTVSVGGVSSTPTCTALAWSASLNVTAVADGAAVSITANHTDAALNNATQASTTVVKDTANPTVAITSSTAINNANKNAYVVTGTCSENTRTVTVNVGGVAGSPVCTALAWSTTVNVSAVGDSASLAITADHSDASGNNATQATTSVVKDTSNPTVAITSSPVINNANKAAYPVSGTCSENTRTVTVNVGGVSGTPTCTALAWSTSLNVTAVADGAAVSITANHTDAVGNAATQDSTTVIKDTANPTVAITVYPVINNANKAAYTFSGTCSENTRTVTVSVGGIAGSATCTALAWSETLDVTALADGAAISILADHTDAAGNNATQASRTVLKSTALPTVAITSSPVINNTNKAAYVVSGTCSENTRIVTVNVGGVSGTPTCSGGNTWTTTLNVTAVADNASVAITADHTDAVGNNAVQATTTVLKDTVIPTVAITSSPVINNANKAAYVVSGTCSEETRTVTVLVGGSVSGTPACTALAWSTTLNVTAVADGAAVAVTANHTDAALNNATQASATVVKDTANPTVAISSNTAINNANKNAYPVSGTCSENTRTVTVSVGGVSATPTCTALVWSTSVNVSAVADSGTVAITADHTDAAGNNATQATSSVVKDTSNPTVAITSSPVINNANKAAYPVSGTCSENTRTVTVNVGGVSGTPTCTALAWSTSLNVTAVADGAAVSITANHTDAVGNAATQDSTTVIKDTANPTIAITSSPIINNTNKAAYTVSGTCSENTRTVTVSVGGVSATPTCTTLAWSATVNVTAVADSGAVAITADHTDAALNNATQATTTVIKDTNVPTVAITSSPVINNANKAAYVVSGTCSENTRTVTVNVGGVSGTPVCTTLAWTTTLNVTGVTDDAAVIITADHTDASGNSAAQATTTVLKDTINPTVAITSSPVINNGNKAVYPVSGTCSENTRTVSVSVGGVAATPTCTALAWSATVNVTAVADSGTVSITANHTDAALNNATQASTTVVKDTSNPTVAITSSPIIFNGNKAAYPVSGTCSENTRTVTVSVGGVTGTPTCTALAWSTSLNVTAVPDGAAIAITADHSDASGNAATQATTSVLKDTVNPTVAITSSPVINNANKTAYTVSGSCSETGRTVTINVGSVSTSDTCTLLTWTKTVDVSGNPDSATLLITADHTDAAGNSAVQAGTTVLKDTTLPTVAITSAPTINNSNVAAYPVSGTCSENTRSVTVSVGGVTATPTCTALAWSATLNVGGVADSGAVPVTADHTDSAGNSATQATTTVNKVTGLPLVAITSSTAINNTNKAAYVISGTCSESGQPVSVNVGGVTGSPTCTAGAWTSTLNVTGVADSATVAATADHSDSAANPATQATASFLKDTVIPTVTITSSPVINNANKAAYVVSGTCSENTRTVSVSVGGVAGSPTCTALAWTTTVNVTAVADGASVSITANHTDAALNNATQASTTVVKDTVNPTVAITSSPVINNANKAAYPVSGTCSENTRTVTVSVGGVAATPTCTALAWSTSVNVTAVADGASVSITADHTDAALNNATQATTTVVKDTSNPTVAVTSSTAINNTNKAAYPVSGTCSENTRTVTVSVGGVAATPTCTALAWSTSVNATAVADNASVTITADHTDVNGNSATQSSVTVLKDTVIPTVSISSAPSINNVNKAAYTVSGACSENTRTVTVSVGGVPATPTCTALAWSAVLNVTGVADGGSVAVTANHSDLAGNAATTASTTTVKDTTNPTVAITSSPVINDANKGAYVVSGTCSENTRAVSVNVGGVTSSPTCTTLAWSATLNVTAVADGGSVAITADHTDVNGNNATQATTTVVKDTVIPTVAISTSPLINNANKAAYPVTGTCSENTRTVTVNVGGVSATPTCTALAWSTSLNVSGVADGASVSVTANHTDAALNPATQASTTVVKDTSNPTVAISSAPAINNANKAAYVISGTCSENTRTVTVNVGGVSGTPTCTTLAWSTTLNVTGVADSATVAVTADHTDAAANAATQATASIVKDTSNPTVAIASSPVINNTNKGAYVVSGTCSENTRTVSVNVGGVTSTPTCTATAWSATLNVTAVADGGSVAITADHTDAVLNNAIQATASVVKDTVIPTVAITSSPAINNTNKAAYPISGTCSENTRTVTVNVGGVSGTPVCTALAWSTSLNVTAVADNAAVAVTADHTDVNGNNATQATTTVAKDTTAPTVAITSSPAINNTNKAAYPVSGTCSENTRTVLVSVGGVTSSPTCSALAWSATLNVTAVADAASVAVTADHTDAAGNFATQASTNVLKDVIIPTVAITSSPAINNANKAAYLISGTCSENTRAVSVNVGGVTSSPTCTALAWSATLNVTGVTDGASVAVTADHTDAALNAATQATTTVAKDTSNPTVAITSSPLINNANKASYTVSGTCSENTRTVSVDVGGVAGTPTCTAGAWSSTLNVTGVADGAAVAITANHTDAAGNNATQASTTVVKDTSNPTVAISSSTVINDANKAAYTVNGTCSENTRIVSVNVGGVAATPTCTALAWSTSVNVTAVGDGASITITADHTDAVGNAATQASTTVLKDTVIPTVAITSSPLINNANQAAYTVSGTCSENTRTVSVNVGGVTSSPTCSALAWSATLNVTAVADSGSVSITANHTDAAANAATQASTTVIKDASLPTVAITSSPSINNTNKAAYVVSGTCSENTRTVSVNVGGVAGTPTCSALAWSSTLDVTAVADGASISITANHSDVSGNNATQASTTVVKDVIIPTVAITSSPAINNANKAAYIVSGTCSENTRTVSVNVGGVAATPTCTALAWSSTLNVTAVADSGSVAVTANHTDAVGNAATQASTTVAKDTSNPTVAITSSPVINNTNKASYTVSGTCSETGRTVSINVGSVSTSDTCTLLTWTATVDVSGNPDSATLLITADHSDSSGNNAVQAGTTVLKDTVIPTVAISSAPLINNANKAAYTISGTCSENTRVVSVNIGGVAASPTCSAGAWSTGAIDVTAAVDSATLSITANHSDSAGNAATQASTSVIKDTSNPTVAITSSPTINLANMTAYTVSGTCSENTRTVAVSIGGVAATPTCSAGAWTTGAINVSTATDSATLSITANHTDANGNSATQASASVIKDTIAPTVALSTSEPATTTSASWTIRATFSEAVTGVALADFVVGNGTGSSLVTVSTSIYDITLVPSAEGTVTVNMAASAATDVAGNNSSAATQLSRTYVTPAVLTYAVATTHDFGSIAVGGSSELSLLINKTGTFNATAVTEIGLAAPYAFKGGAFPGTGGTCTTTITASCTLVIVYTPTTAAVHNDAIQLQYNNGSSVVSASRSLTGTGVILTPTKLAVTGPSGIPINQCITYTINTQTASGVNANVTSDQAITLVVNNGTGTFYSNNTCATAVTTTTVTTGTSSKVIYFRSTTQPQNLTLVFNPPAALTSTTVDVATSSAPTRIAFTTPIEMERNTCVPIVVALADAAGNEVGKSVAVQVNLAQNGAAVFYSDSNCTGVITTISYPAFTETKTIYVKDATAQSVLMTFTDNAAILTQDSATVSFVNALTWWNASYLKRKPIILNNQDQATAHTNMPVLVKLNSSNFNYADALAAGADIRFTLDDHTTALNYEIESWNTSGDSFIWVRVPTIAASVDKIIYMYYNNTSAVDGQNATSTWTGFSGVWNMKKTGANYIDSTGSGKTGVPEGTITDMTGPTGNAVGLDGASSINTNYNLAQIIGVSSTFSFWMRSNVTGSSQFFNSPSITGVREDSAFNEIYFGWISSTGFIGITARNGASRDSSYVVTDNSWRHVTMTRDSGTGNVRFFVNGVLTSSGASGAGVVTTAFTRFGYRGGPGAGFFTGSLDGIRLQNSVQTDARIKAEYKFGVQTNISYGAAEDY